jgi:hypothetical protein
MLYSIDNKIEEIDKNIRITGIKLKNKTKFYENY